jgi:hypothetical protein
MRWIMIFVVLVISIASAEPAAFRAVSRPATRAPYSIAEIIKQAKLAQRCDSQPDSPITLVPVNTISRRLNTLIDEDQKIHSDETIDLTTAERANRTIRQEVIQYILQNQLITDTDFYYAGFIFHHGSCSDSFLLAHELAGVTIALNESKVPPGKRASEGRELYAQTYDRYLLSIGLPQRFGTQRRFDGPDCQFVLEPFDPNITNEERTLYEVATFNAAEEKAAAAKCPQRK